ncbi:DUF2723 domain-containing protein [Dysgonomonas sp. ZJ279]|uniref:glycosyltransferase family 117 protein n=1 Tax=Dysgonomonas sp. ZJ279 TaxID=2709796 RepID=UPI0013EB82F2|nr:DUF2723 domain-containing protein [Dysgonomonas sp. ZJ279]
MKRYNLINNVFGWFSFAIAAIVYLMTIEPTASFWDCGEFITSAYKLEVGHPPGAPFFMLTGKFFTLFASDTSQVAMMVNAMSALLSALTILFLFWTITHLAKKLIYSDKSNEMTLGQLIIIMGCGLVGALTYTFTDTFWFSAVEGEVYAYSSMFTALVFWLILKWENRADKPGSDKWLIIIAYAMGLSIGVHLLNLLCIPAIVLVYYFKKRENANLKGTLLALAGSFALIVLLMYGIIPGFTKVGGWFELLFVNDLGFSYNTGAFVYIILIAISIIWGLYETMSVKGNMTRAKIAFIICMILSGVTFIGSNAILSILLIGALVAFIFINKKINFRQLNTTILCLMVILIGYSSFALIPIRSIANPPMDQNSPEHLFTLANYLNREQYGDRPLFHGKTFASSEARDPQTGRIKPPVSEKKNYDKVVKKSPDQKDMYVVSGTAPTYEYSNTMTFPRMYSDENRHLIGYQIWGGIKDTKVQPTMFQNLQFFFTYQLDFMYFRYFMWNFSGRQNDIQGTGSLNNGNWITGISFVDEMLGRGPQDNLPPDIADNKGHNAYYALPFLLGVLGIFFQLTRKKEGEQQFLITFMLFFMTGIAIILYLNQQPFEPRERDYAYAGSFYAFCIWIGFGVAFLWRLLKKVLPEAPAAAIATVATILIPIQMASQNWDDHDRSDRYTMRDFGMNYLRGCEPNSILFSMGDNDTFPLWYAQEVEGFRTDVRVCNLSYLQTDWYVDQMRRQAYDSEPLPINWERDRYFGNKGQAAYVLSRKDLEKAITSQLQQSDMKNFMGHIRFNDYFDVAAFKDTMQLSEVTEILKTQDNHVPRNPFIEKGVVIPSSIYTTPINTANVDWAKLGTKPKSDFTINVGDDKNAVYRQEIMIMEMLYNINKDDWKRPLYYAVTIGESPINLSDQAMLEGITYRILPGVLDSTGVNTEVMFDNMVNKYQWGGIENPKVYLDENNLRMCRSFRMMFDRLITALLEQGKNDKALVALDKCITAIPGNTVPRGGESILFADAYFELGEKEKGQMVANEIMDRVDASLQWYKRLKQQDMVYCSSDIREYMDIKLKILDIYQRYDRTKYQPLLDQIMAETDLFLSNGVSFNDRAHPLDFLMRVAIRGYMIEEDTTAKKAEGATMEKAAGLIQKYKPELLQKYFGQ